MFNTLISNLIVFVTIRGSAQSMDINISSVKDPVMNLNGIWEINSKPDKNSLADKKFIMWQDIYVPGELAIQCFEIQYNKSEALLVKKANMNFIYTSHSPLSERFLKLR